jgi:predicted O-methyltransferase YrrM
MTTSLPFADVLGAWCRALRPRTIAELGTGFSSWVVRRWSPPGAEVVSVDDDPEWRARSRAFVRDEGLREGEFVSWEAFRGRGRSHELVVWDFSDVRTRASATPEAADRVAPGGALLFDDVHKHRLWRRARRLARRPTVEGFSLHALTLDEYGRYAWLALFGHRADRP